MLDVECMIKAQRIMSLKAAKYEIQKSSTCRATSFSRCFPFFTLRDQPVPKQKHLLRVEKRCCEK